MGRNIKFSTFQDIINDIDGLVQDCSSSIANALELLQSCIKASICYSWSCCNDCFSLLSLLSHLKLVVHIFGVWLWPAEPSQPTPNSQN